jgi:hypothetical protein
MYCLSAQIVLVGLRSDLRSPEDIHSSREQGQLMAEIIGACAYVECSARNNDGVKNVFSAAIEAASKPVSRFRSKSVLELERGMEAILRTMADFQINLAKVRVDIKDEVEDSEVEREDTEYGENDMGHLSSLADELASEKFKTRIDFAKKAQDGNPLVMQLNKVADKVAKFIPTAETVFNLATTTEECQEVEQILGVCYIILKVVNVAKETYEKMATLHNAPTYIVNVQLNELCNALNIMGELKIKQIASNGDFKAFRAFAESYKSSNYEVRTNNKYLYDTVQRIVKCFLPQGCDGKGRLLPKTVLLYNDYATDRCTYTPAKEQVYKLSPNRRHFKLAKTVDQPWDDLVFLAASIMAKCRRTTEFSIASARLQHVDDMDAYIFEDRDKKKNETAAHSWAVVDSMWAPVCSSAFRWTSIVDSQPVVSYGYVRIRSGFLYYAEVSWPLSSYISITKFSLLGGMDADAEQRVKDLRILWAGDIIGVVLPLAVAVWLVWAWLHQLIVSADFLAAIGLYVTIVITMWQTLLPTLTYDYTALVTRSVKVTSVEQVMWCLGLDKASALTALGAGLRWNTPIFTGYAGWACWHDGKIKNDGVHNVEWLPSWWNRSSHDNGFVGLLDLLKVGYIPSGVWATKSPVFSLSDGTGMTLKNGWMI